MAFRTIERGVGFFSEFWKFAAKGNIFDLAIGVILGTAFGAIVNSLVADIIMPLLSFATNGVNFSEWSYVIRPAISMNGATTAAVALNYGKLIQVTLNFLIVGLSIFTFVKLFSKLRERVARKEKGVPAEPVSTEERLLSEIRDILKEEVEQKRSNGNTNIS